jgi:hypothetical protein
MKLAPHQMRAMAGDARESYAARVATETGVRFPAAAARLGPDGLRSACAQAIEHGRELGLESELDLYRFTCLAFALGPRFDEDPALPWAGATLRSGLLGEPSRRLSRTYALARAAAAQSGRPWLPPLPKSAETARGTAS